MPCPLHHKGLCLMEDSDSLVQFDKYEWRDITRMVRPDITDDEFEEMWAEFAEMKANKELQ